MTDETIPKGDVSGASVLVPESPESPQEATPLWSPGARREERLAAVAEKRRAEVEEERKAAALRDNPDLTADEYDAKRQPESPPPVASTEDEGQVPIGAKEVAETKGAEVTAPPATPQQNGWQTRQDGVRVKTLMVNGEAKQFTEEQYDRMLQKDLAGDQKLRLASEYERKLAERQRALEERERILSQQSQQPPRAGASQDIKGMIAKHSELLLDGETDAANAMMAEIIEAGRASSTPNLDAIAEQAATRIEARTAQKAHEESVKAGWEEFQREYTDVLADPDALAFADIQVKNLRANGNLTPKEIILQAGEITRTRLGLSGAAPAPAPVGGDGSELRAARQQRKANIKPIPSIGATKHTPRAAPALDMSPEAKIARMRGSRKLA